MHGYCGKILRIDLNDKKGSKVAVEKKDAEQFIGGTGFGIKIHYEMRSFEKDAFSAENPLVIMTGPLTALAPGTSRVAFCAKSPLTGIWGESNSGGKMANYLKFAGWDGLIIEGKSEKPVYLVIDSNGAEFIDAAEIWGKGCYEAQEMIEKELKEKRASTAVIGPAGENLVKFACIQVDNSRHAGRTGMGAVMGSKLLKGIAVVYDAGKKFEISIADEKGFKSVQEKFIEAINNDFTCTMLRELGTSGYVETAEGFGDLPVKYFTEGTFEGASRISGSAMASSILKGNDGCLGCIVRCGRVVEHKGKKIHGPEYETVASFGSLQLNDSLEAIVELNYMLNDLGIDTISAGVTIAFAMWMTERGIGEFNVRWGDAERVKEIIEDIAFRRGIGNELAEGVRFLERKYNLEGYGAHVKGLEIPMHDARAFSSLACAYAVHNRGACHLPHQMYLYEMGKTIEEYGVISPDRFANEGKGTMTAKVQNFSELFNAVTMCAFMPITPTMLAEMLKFATGLDFTVESIATAGERIFTLKRLYNLKCGIKAEDDTLPKIVLQPVKGGSDGRVPDVKRQVEEYYEFRKWPNGIPSKEKLKELNLEWAE
uniref:Aldehyde ferredoxin oxidoreductase n=1 Tax=Archaeoglobus fulgidus TaxID=2234 RepID=A0A7J2THS3_ARCFL